MAHEGTKQAAKGLVLLLTAEEKSEEAGRGQ